MVRAPSFTCQSGAVLLQLAGEEALPLGHLLVPGVQDPAALGRLQVQRFRVGLLDVGPHTLQAVGVEQVAAHHAHQQLVQRVVVHEVAAPPRTVRDGAEVLTAAVVGVQKAAAVVGEAGVRVAVWEGTRTYGSFHTITKNIFIHKANSKCFT